MRLASVSVRKYRSIDKQAEFAVGDFTVLLGANNQGKSNLLRATVLAMNAIDGWAKLNPALASRHSLLISTVLRNHRIGVRRRGSTDVDYDWERDYPLFARSRRGAQKSTVIQLNFELDQSEQAEFKRETEISINEHLPVQVSFDERHASIAIPKQGKGNHGQKAREIAAFVSNRIGLLYIPAIRTSAAAIRVAEEILAARRRRVLSSDRYASLVRELEELDAEAVADVEGVLATTLTRFVPGAVGVTVQTASLSRAQGVEEILIDDGVSTPLANKGDGIQSLVALGLTLEWTRSTAHPDKQLVIAVEEPESHLHPGAVHELRKVLQGIAETQQVVVTTHSQSLVNRKSLGRNIIVGDRGAEPARELAQLRTALGVRLSDALAAVEVTIIGEGEHDETTLRALLSSIDSSMCDLLEDGRVIIESAGSGSKIYARALAARTILTRPIVVIDGDAAGKRDVEKLLTDGILDETSIIQAVRPKCKHSELEDLFLLESTLPAIERAVGFELAIRERRKLELGRNEAWSERLEAILTARGMPNARGRVKVAKAMVNESIQQQIEQGARVLRPDCEPLFDRLIQVTLASVGSR